MCDWPSVSGRAHWNTVSTLRTCPQFIVPTCHTRILVRNRWLGIFLNEKRAPGNTEFVLRNYATTCKCGKFCILAWQLLSSSSGIVYYHCICSETSGHVPLTNWWHSWRWFAFLYSTGTGRKMPRSSVKGGRHCTTKPCIMMSWSGSQKTEPAAVNRFHSGTTSMYHQGR